MSSEGVVGHMWDICWIYVGHMCDICGTFVGHLCDICVTLNWTLTRHLLDTLPYRLGPSKIEFSLERGCKNEEFQRFEKKAKNGPVIPQ